MNWKNIIRGIVYSLVILIILFLFIAIFLPKSYRVQKEYTINAPVDTVYKFVSDLSQWSKWSPWQRMDSAAVYTYSPSTTGIGAWMAWESPNKDGVGTGKLTVDNEIVNQQVSYTLEFYKPFESSSQGGFFLEGDSTKTVVQWYDAGACKWPVGRYIGVMMDNMLGPDFQKGLVNLDSVCMKAMDPMFGDNNQPTEVEEDYH